MIREKAVDILLLSILYVTAKVHCKHLARQNDVETSDDDTRNELSGNEKDKMLGSAESLEHSDIEPERLKVKNTPTDNKNCWLDLGVRQFYNTMDSLDANYEKVRHDYQNAVGTDDFDREMLKAILEDQGKAQRALHNVGGDPKLIPAGLNLGGYCMMRMENSLLFFHRMKLRNSTRFQINYLHNDLVNMLLIARLSLNDLHLFGEYERAVTEHDPSYLKYKPTYGQVEILLKDAEYKMEGRYRLIKDRLVIELIISEVTVKDVIIKCPSCGKKDNVGMSSSKFSTSIEHSQIAEFKERLKLDLDRWLKDYFNDYLTLFTLIGASSKANFLKYDKQKSLVLNDYVDRSLNLFKAKLRQMRAAAFKVPDFTLHTSNGMVIKLRKGVLRGLDSMHRRSVATGKTDGKVRYVDAIIGFSKLKLEYKYEGQLMDGMPPLNGMFILSADELTAQIGLMLVKDPETFDLSVDFSQQVKPESLTVEGAINRRIANFKHLLENQIISIMSNTLIHHIRMLSYLSKCGSNYAPLPGHVDSGELFSEESFPTHRPTDSYEKPNPDKSNENSDGDNGKISGKGYAVYRVESAELILPPSNNEPAKKMHLKYKEDFSLDEVATEKGDVYIPPDAGSDSGKDGNDSAKDDTGSGRDDTGSGKDDTGSGRDDTGSGKDNTGSGKDSDNASNGSANVNKNNKKDQGKNNPNGKVSGKGYALNKVESAELVLPPSDHEPAKKMHLQYKEDFLLDEARRNRNKNKNV